jgi:hypothetical protein
MQQRRDGSAALLVTIAAVAIILAAANVAALILIVGATGAIHGADLAGLSRLHLAGLLYFVGAPLLAGVILALLAARRPAAAVTGGESGAALAPPPPSPALALRLLGLLQQEGRLVDFISEDIASYSDAQVGAAVRAIHAGCRKVLNEHVQLQRILAGEDGSEVAVDPGFDPAAVRLTGNVTGNPPFRGTLQHSGWRATNITLPDTSAAADPAIIAPAEVEIP